MASKLKAVISADEYSALDIEDKGKYRVYVPESDIEIQAGLDLANAEIKAISYLKPLHDKIMAMPVDLPGKQFAQAIETLETLISLLDPIKALMGVPIIGQLVAPLVNFLNNLIQVLGSIFYICMCLMLMKDIFTDSYVKAIDDIKWDELKDAKETIKLKKEAYEKAKKEKEEAEAKKTDEQKKAEADERKKKMEEEKKKIEEAAKKEYEKDKKEIEEQIQKMYDGLELGEAYAKIMKAMKISLQQYSWKEGNIKQACKKVLESLGVDLSPLDQMTAEQQKAFSKQFPDPKDQIESMNALIHKMNKNTKYALIPGIEPYEEEIVEELNKDEIKVDTPKQTDIRATKLSDHYYLYELCYSKTAEDNHIENIPSESEIENLRLVCVNILEPIYKQFGKPIITSGYRNSTVNALVKGVENSEHVYGRAVDIVVPSISVDSLSKWIARNCVYRQLILERSKTSHWVHVSYNCTDNKCQNLTYNDGITTAGLLTKENKRLV